MCGDATNPDDVARLINNNKINLVLTDPPYGINVQNKNGFIGGNVERILPHGPLKIQKSKCVHQKMIGDDNQDTARKNYEIIKNLTNNLIIWGGQYFAHFLPINGGWLFWDKKRGKGTTFSEGELAWCSKGNRVRKYEHLWNGGVCREGSLLLNPRPRVHPTQKPTELHMQILEDFSKPEDIVLDCFAGSGTTLIACEQTGRRCLAMEISSEYCDVIIKRYNGLKTSQRKESFS